jgi:hypothetical protein
MMRHDPCEANGIVTGRYRADEDNTGEGEFQGRLARSSGDIVLEFVGDWRQSVSGDGTGAIDGVFETNAGEEGVVEGMYFPRLNSASGPLATFQSSLEMPQAVGQEPEGEVLQVLRGVWHTLSNGDGIMVGYRAKCTMPDVIDPAE